MPITVDDLVGLNAETIRDMPLITAATQAQAIVDATLDASVSIAGMRHSQGGHTAVQGGRMLMAMAGLNRIDQPQPVKNQPYAALVAVEAGATWGELHQVLGPEGYGPMVQQSSADFTIGGSLSVNCHGRDPRWGPLSSSVEDITVLTATQGVLQASRTVNQDLFNAALGGYGACGMILRATLRVVPNTLLQYIGDKWTRQPFEYETHIENLLRESPDTGDTHLHYGWMCCVQGRLYDKMVVADFRPVTDEPVKKAEFKEHDWGMEELLRAGWSAARRDPVRMRDLVWDALCYLHIVGTEGMEGKGHEASRIDWLRASVDFTSFRGDTSAEILQEYFVPATQIGTMIDALRDLFAEPRSPVNVLSTTLRVVRQDDETVLSYCPGGPRVCIAVDAEVSTVLDRQGHRDLHPLARSVLDRAIQQALALEGTYYLPYFKLADLATFRQAYPRHAVLQQAIDKYNPLQAGHHKFWNGFLNRYFV